MLASSDAAVAAAEEESLFEHNVRLQALVQKHDACFPPAEHWPKRTMTHLSYGEKIDYRLENEVEDCVTSHVGLPVVDTFETKRKPLKKGYGKAAAAAEEGSRANINYKEFGACVQCNNIDSCPDARERGKHSGVECKGREVGGGDRTEGDPVWDWGG